MDKQAITVVLILAALIGAVVFTAVFSGGGRSGPGLQADQRFSAKPGTSRENALLLTSRRSSTGASFDGSGKLAVDAPGTNSVRTAVQADTTAERVIRAKSLSRPDDEAALSSGDMVAREALNALTPEAGIARVERAISELEVALHNAAMYEALAQLALQLDPPDRLRAQQALDYARTHARTEQERHRVALATAQLFLSENAVERAMIALEEAAERATTPTAPLIEVHTLLGSLYESAGDFHRAESSYLAAIAAGKDVSANDPEVIRGAQAAAGMRLTRLYRALGRADEAQAVSGKLIQGDEDES